MKQTGKFRIVFKTSDFWVHECWQFYVEQECVGLRGRKKWRDKMITKCDPYGESYQEPARFETKVDAVRWIGALLAEEGLLKEYRTHGPVIVWVQEAEYRGKRR